MASRRSGDAPILVAEKVKAGDQLGWTSSHDLDAILPSAWRWRDGRAASGR